MTQTLDKEYKTPAEIAEEQLKMKSLKKDTDKLFGKYLADDTINEIVANGNGTIFIEDIHGNWIEDKENFNKITYKEKKSFTKALTSFNKIPEADKTNPSIDATLHTGERVNVTIPPQEPDNQISITIRKPSKTRYTLDDYIERGSLSLETAQFLQNAVREGRNLVICGETGSGKTTFMKTLIDFIPSSERIITIEDTSEIIFYNHRNVDQLFYPSDAKMGDKRTAATCLKACLRKKPDRILLAELRGAETFDFLNVITSGHNGTITSCHAGSVKECYFRLVMMSMQNPQAQACGRDLIMEIVKRVIDVVVVFKRELTPDNKKVRRIVEMLYDGKIYKRQENGDFIDAQFTEI